MSCLQVENVSCRYNGRNVLEQLSLTVADNEIVCLLGASGCGKTTLLKAIAGLLPLAGGAIRLGETLLEGPGENVPPEARNIGMIFQDYALFPHLTVADNIGFGLTRLERSVRQQQVVHRRTGITQVLETRRLFAAGVPEEGAAPGFVERRPDIDETGQFAAGEIGVVGKAIGDVAIDPAAAILQALRQIPVIERDERLQTLGFECFKQAFVERQSLRVGPAAGIHDARPGERKAVGVETDVLD